jgi:hypothetical protein|tara:strand:- start:579 stop:797 length:219 start_codon:yes stop_codon:yes gene_type:complete
MDINLIMGYLIMGMVWVMILEYLSTLGERMKPEDDWTMVERIWNIIIWPITLMMMAHKLFEHINNNKDGEDY